MSGKRPSVRVPSEEQVAAIARAGLGLLDAIHRYSKLIGGKRWGDLPTKPSVYTYGSLHEAVGNLERVLNPRKTAQVHSGRSSLKMSGWPFVVGDALSWLEASLDTLLTLFGWEGKAIVLHVNPGQEEAKSEDAEGRVWIKGDPSTFTLPVIDEDLTGRIETSVSTLADAVLRDELAQLTKETESETEPPAPAEDKPRWDKETHELRFKGQLIRRVRPIADNVIRVLDTFEDDGWPRRIDDPLDPSPETRRISETLRTLNDGLKMIRFRADGTGEGIIWEPDAGQ